MTKVLIVEDDPGVASGLVKGLRTHGFDIELATNGTEGLRKALVEGVDAIILDIMLPEKSGFEVLTELRERSKVPVLVLTARNDLDDRLKAFELGAVDFIPKPFWLEEVVARLRLRLSIKASAEPNILRVGDLAIDLDARNATIAGREIDLTKYEFDILAHLVEHQNRAISRAQLIASVLNPLESREERTVDTHVARIRKKIVPYDECIGTVWGIGYKFDSDKAKP